MLVLLFQIVNGDSTNVYLCLLAKIMPSPSPVLSPLTHSAQVAPLRAIDCDHIIQTYRNQLNIDVTPYIKGLKQLYIYTCLETGYQFYYPFGLEGDGAFYQALQDFPWYYQDWKWEFKLALEYINPCDRVLEIGCGRSAFIRNLTKQEINCTGLEFNAEAVQFGLQQGFNILSQSIELHAQNHSAQYDVVCSFQVLEHVTDVKSFIQSAIDCLKVGGKLILAVPNNQSFIQHDKQFVLNMPPHHAGLWSEESLSNLPKIFPLKLDQIAFEPLALENCSWYYDVQARRFREITRQVPLLNKLINRFTIYMSDPGTELIKRFRHRIRSHSLLAVYTRIL